MQKLCKKVFSNLRILQFRDGRHNKINSVIFAIFQNESTFSVDSS